MIIHRLLLASFVKGNWLHQCSQCIDQSFFSDMSLKTDIRSANTSILYEQLKQVSLREFEHLEKEFYNRFFSRTQLGLVAQELQSIAPSAVSLIPERRYTSSNGTQISSRNVLMVRESHLLFMLLGGFQEVGRRVDAMGSDYWSRVVDWSDQLEKLSSHVILLKSQNEGFHEYISKNKEKLNWLNSQWEGMYKLIDIQNDKLVGASADLTLLSRELTQLKQSMKDLNEQQAQERSDLKHRIGVIKEGMTVAIENVLNETRSENSGLREKIKEMNRKIFMSFVNCREREHELGISKLRLLLKLETGRKLNELDLIKTRSNEEIKAISMQDELTKTRNELMASRREEFDKELVRLNEESRLRVLREKNEQERLLAEKQLEFEKEKLSVEMAIRIEQARIDSEMKFRDRRENEDVNLRELGEKNSAEKERVLVIIKETANIVSTWIKELYSNPDNLILGIGSILAIALGIYASREGAQLVREEISRRLGKPDLIRVTSRRGIFSDLLRRNVSEAEAFSGVVLNPDLMDQIKRLAMATKSSHSRSSPLVNCMFYGSPGTGKTLVAKKFAEFSGLDYAIMSGGDVAPLGKDGVTEIHRLFKWVNSSRRGVLLFIDEAESFLGQRTSGMSENLRNAITALLYHTGTASSKFMMIIATNRPGDLDSAIVDRIDESIEFPLPNVAERQELVGLYYKEYVGKEGMGVKNFAPIAAMVKGFSGREISKLMMSVNTHLLMSPKTAIEEVVLKVTKAKISEHEKARHMAKEGYQFVTTELD
jgi:ATPase family AAA domain-containing protein 3A/B